MEFATYDKAKWHWGAKSAPTDITPENGGTHIAFFLRWCIENDFYSEQMEEDFPDEMLSVKNQTGTVDVRELFVMGMDGVLSTEELNGEGNLFATAYYASDKYLNDYSDFVDKKFGDDNFDNAYFYIENSEENYQAVKKIIDGRYAEFLLTK